MTRPGDSRFGVSVYPPPGQSVHTLTPACQRREQQDITIQRTERERASQSKKQRGRVFTFLNKVQIPADSNKTVQLSSLLTQANLSSTLEAWLVNMNCKSHVDFLLMSEVWLDCLIVEAVRTTRADMLGRRCYCRCVQHTHT